MAGGIVTGVIVGTLRSLTSAWAGAAVLGFLSALAVFAAIRIAVDGLSDWSTQDLTGIVGLSLALGPFGGVVFLYFGRRLKRELEGGTMETHEKGS